MGDVEFARAWGELHAEVVMARLVWRRANQVLQAHLAKQSAAGNVTARLIRREEAAAADLDLCIQALEDFERGHEKLSSLLTASSQALEDALYTRE